MMPFEFEDRTSIKNVDLIRSMCKEEFAEIEINKQLSLSCVEIWKSEAVFNSRFPHIVKIAFVKCFSKYNERSLEYWKTNKPNQIVVQFSDFGLDCIDFDKGVEFYDENGSLLNTIAIEGHFNPSYSTGTFYSCAFTPILKCVEYETDVHGAGVLRDNSKLEIDSGIYTDFFSAFFKVKKQYSPQQEVRLVLCLRACHKIDIPKISKIIIHLQESFAQRIKQID